MEYNIKANIDDFYYKYLSAINGLLNLSKKEILILSEFIKYTIKYKGDSNIIFSTTMRKKIADKVGISTYNFNNYIKMLKGKKAIIDTGGVLSINKRIIMPYGDTKILFNIIIKDE